MSSQQSAKSEAFSLVKSKDELEDINHQLWMSESNSTRDDRSCN